MRRYLKYLLVTNLCVAVGLAVVYAIVRVAQLLPQLGQVLLVVELFIAFAVFMAMYGGTRFG